MNRVSKLATKVAASTAAGIAGIATVVLLTASGGATVSADGVCTDDMHWVVCPTVEQVTDTVTDITDGLTGDLTDDMHW
ncbi:MAG: hypothetical protein WBA97_20060 [Actinophytocola sp.]|uniref:hypothetical protein n=1 Tax=Actinophytocola sp. TaxID=1872138 RepID=UPI003C78A704